MYLVSAAFSRASSASLHLNNVHFAECILAPDSSLHSNHTLRSVCEVRRKEEVRNGVFDVIYVSTVLAHHFPLGYLRFYQ